MIKVAIVDDKSFIRNSLAQRITTPGYISVIFTAGNGEEFLEKMKSSPEKPDIVFMDIDMPVMNGIEAIAIASEIYPNTKFIVLTVFDDDEKIFESIKAGAIGYLLKDENTERLKQSIEEVIKYNGSPMTPSIARKSIQMLSKSSSRISKPEQDTLLSEREMEILKGILEGKNYKMLAEELFLSPHTIRTHIANIYKKLHVCNKAQAIKVAMKKGWFNFIL